MRTPKFSIGQIRNAIGLIIFVLGVVYFPVKSRFAEIDKTIIRMEKDHTEHCVKSNDKFKNVPLQPVIEIQFAYISTELTEIKKEIANRKEIDSNLQKTLDAILLKLN